MHRPNTFASVFIRQQFVYVHKPGSHPRMRTTRDEASPAPLFRHRTDETCTSTPHVISTLMPLCICSVLAAKTKDMPCAHTCRQLSGHHRVTAQQSQPGSSSCSVLLPTSSHKNHLYARVHTDFDFFIIFFESRTSRARSDMNVCREAGTSNKHNTATALFEFVQHAVARRVLRGSRHTKKTPTVLDSGRARTLGSKNPIEAARAFLKN